MASITQNTITLHFGKQKYFLIDGGKSSNRKKNGDFEIDLDSYFVTKILGLLTLNVKLKKLH